jgi:hypothetical protein
MNIYIMRTIFYVVFIIILCGISNNAKGQRKVSLGFWKITNVDGYVGIDGFYNYKLFDGQNYSDVEKISHIAPTISIKTKNYIWNSNFLYLKINGEYSPEYKRNISEVFPDRIGDISKKKIGVHGELFKKSKIIISGYYNINDFYYNSESISLVKTKGRTWGVNLGYRDQKLPVQLSFVNSNLDQDKSLVNHKYSTNRKKLTGSLSKRFFKKDRHKLKYEYSDVSRGYSFTDDTKQKYQRFVLNSVYFLDKSNNHVVHTNVQNLNQKGILNSNNVSFDARYGYKLPYDFYFNTEYLFSDFSGEFSHNKSNSIIAFLSHKLFLSLNTKIQYEYRKLNQTSFDKNNIRRGIYVNYRKKIPKGTFDFSYVFANEKSNRTDISDIFYVNNEEHVISDMEMVLLDKPNVVKESVVIKSLGGAIIYYENVDYYLIDQGDYIEVQRIPGGEISNNDVILVDYMAYQEPDNSYSLFSNALKTKISLFKNLISVYFNIEEYKFANSVNYEYSSYREYTLFKTGIESRSKFHKVGMSYEQKVGEILSYTVLRPYANGYLNVKRFRFSLSGSYSKYLKSNNQQNHFYLASSFGVRYSINSKSSVVYNIVYREQDGENFYLNFLKSKINFQMQFRAWTCSLGLEYFHRYMANSDVQLVGGFLSFKRVF